jgi:choline dehydrogenase
MTYIRGDIAQFDAWEKLGNKGWNWAALFPYYKKSENYTIPLATQLAAGATYQPQNHGFKGHVHVGYPLALVNGSAAPAVIDTWEGLSLPHNPDLNRGSVRGFGMGPQTLDPQQNIRWDAARAYIYPAQSRTNLKILQGTVKRITWAPKKNRRSSSGGSLLVASGVEYLTADGKTHAVLAKKEVIVSAGSVRSPLVLESSGVGNPRYKTNADTQIK